MDNLKFIKDLVKTYQKGGVITNNLSPSSKRQKYDILKKNYVESGRAIGANDEEKLSTLRLDQPYNSNDLTRDYIGLQRARKELNLPFLKNLKEEASLTFPHVGYQIKGTFNNIMDDILKWKKSK